MNHPAFPIENLPANPQAPGPAAIVNALADVPCLYPSAANYLITCAHIGCSLPTAPLSDYCCDGHRTRAANFPSTLALDCTGGFRNDDDRKKFCCVSLYNRRRNLQIGVPTLPRGTIFTTLPWEQNDIFRVDQNATQEWLFFTDPPEQYTAIGDTKLNWLSNTRKEIRLPDLPNAELIYMTPLYLKGKNATDQLQSMSKAWTLYLFQAGGFSLYCLSHRPKAKAQSKVSSVNINFKRPPPPEDDDDDSPRKDSTPPPPQGSSSLQKKSKALPKAKAMKEGSSSSSGVCVKERNLSKYDCREVDSQVTRKVCWGKQLMGRDLCLRDRRFVFEVKEFSEDPWVTTIDYIRSEGLLSDGEKAPAHLPDDLTSGWIVNNFQLANENVGKMSINQRSLTHLHIIRFKEARYLFQQLFCGVDYCQFLSHLDAKSVPQWMDEQLED